jgi:hypothetical protein
VSDASAATAPDASALQPATDAAAPAPATTADAPVVQQPPAVPTAPARAPGVTGVITDMAVATVAAAGAAAAATGAAAAVDGDDGGANDQAVELDRQAAWADPEARAADAAEWEARQAKPSHLTRPLSAMQWLHAMDLLEAHPAVDPTYRAMRRQFARVRFTDEAVPSPAGLHGSHTPLFRACFWWCRRSSRCKRRVRAA